MAHSLAKWKRMALKNMTLDDEGLYTNMNAIRRIEDLVTAFIPYVDQWDMEKVIRKIGQNRRDIKDNRTSYL